MHRFIWNLMHAGAWNIEAEQGEERRGGPLVVPGAYLAKLVVDGWTDTKKFRVLIDLRVKEDGVSDEDLIAQESLSLQVRDTLTQASHTADRVRKTRKSQQFSRDKDKKLAAVYSKLVMAKSRYAQPMLINQLNYLLSMLNRADQPPGRDAYQRFEELSKELSWCISEIDVILGVH